ncbi:MAG: type transport system permease protein [Chloroflexota bacterium]|jgi:ABC-2 type transport system permease protein|nr:type transport system permease protein [Chloroflexota bacterium]
MANLAAQVYLSYKALFFWLNWPGVLGNIVARPMLNVAMFSLVGRFAGHPDAAQRYVLGMALYSIAEIVTGGVIQTFSRERASGTLPLLYCSPASRWWSYAARAGMHYPNGLIAFTLSVAFGAIFLGFDYSRTNWPLLIIAVLAVTLSSTGYALLIGDIALLYRNWTAIYSLSGSALLLLTGVLIPLSALPPPLQAVAQILPLTHGLEAFRAAFAGGDLAAVTDALAWELILAITYGLIGFASYRWIEETARRTGMIEAGI